MEHGQCRPPVVMLLVTLIVCCCATVAAEERLAEGDDKQADTEELAVLRQRGRYLTHHVAMCVQCHTPRDARGNLKRERLFAGGRIPIQQPLPNQEWSLRAPRLAGLPGWKAEELIDLLTKGRRADAAYPRPPMPPFRLEREDARAVVTYLQSLR